VLVRPVALFAIRPEEHYDLIARVFKLGFTPIPNRQKAGRFLFTCEVSEFPSVTKSFRPP
jgi:hypothetical protein